MLLSGIATNYVPYPNNIISNYLLRKKRLAQPRIIRVRAPNGRTGKRKDFRFGKGSKLL